jgi:hypothetical protein
MNFEKFFCFDGENMHGSLRYYTEDKSKYQTMLALLKKNILKKYLCGKSYQIEEFPYLIIAILSQWLRYRNLYQRVLTTSTLTIHTQTLQ